MKSALVGCCKLALVVEYSPFAAEKYPILHATEIIRLILHRYENDWLFSASRIDGLFLVPYP